jgi:phytoene dehydrogenase-like protein
VAAHSVLRLDEPISGAAALVMLGSAHHDGWPFPEGGAGRISAAMAASLQDLGGTIETARDVDSLEDLPRARVALFDTSPRALASVAGARLPYGYRRKLRAYRYGPAVFKLDIAIEGPIPWRNEAVGRAGTVHLGGTFEEIARSEADATAGSVNDRPFVLLAQQSLFDRTRAPRNRNAVWAYSHVPNGTTIDYTEIILGQIERFAPGFRERIVGTHVRTPAQIEADNPNYVGGDIATGAATPMQVVFRPTRSLNPYATGIAGVYICSAATPPGGGVHGMGGANAATAALKARKG